MRGATPERVTSLLSYTDFNPRTPCGVRRLRLRLCRHSLLYFNPRTPCGVRPKTTCGALWRALFQSTHPMRGATQIVIRWDLEIIDFNPRTPCGVRHQNDTEALAELIFQSTHPMRGATESALRKARQQNNFNPRTPCGVRPGAGLYCIYDFSISIHAPHAGCDQRKWFSSSTKLLFQSTHPMRGATPCC